MSKESSIKVFAENFSGSDKPVNAISVWLENASDIPGGGGSIPSNVSGKWEDASDCVQTNSGTWGQGGGSIPSSFSANNITAKDSIVVGQLENSDWGYQLTGDGAILLSGDGNAYKAEIVSGGFVDVPYVNYDSQYKATIYHRSSLQYGQTYYIDASLGIKSLYIDYYFGLEEDIQEIHSSTPITSFTVQPTGQISTQFYVIGSTNENDSPNYPSNPIDSIIQVQTIGDERVEFKPYIVGSSAFKIDDDGQAYKIENGSVSSIPTPTAQPSNNSREYSKNDLMRVNYSSYSTSLMWKLDTEWTMHQNTSSVDLTQVDDTAWDTATKLSVTSTDWMQQNPSIYYVSTGVVETPYLLSGSDVTKWNNAANRVQSDSANYISVSGTMATYSGGWDAATYDVSYNVMPHTAEWNDATQVVQSNSAQWSQGGGSDTPEILDVVFHYNYGSYNNGEIINNTQSAINIKFNLQTNYQPSDLYIDGSPYTWSQDPDNPNFYIISTNIFPGNSMRGIPLSYTNNNTNYESIIINDTYSGRFGDRTLTLYGKNAYFSGDNAYPYNITKFSPGGMQPLTSFNGNFSYSAMTNDAIYIEVYGQDDEGIPYDTYGSFISSPEPTVTSGDVFPPTTGLTQGSKYYLAWNTNNGGLYWEYVGN